MAPRFKGKGSRPSQRGDRDGHLHGLGPPETRFLRQFGLLENQRLIFKLLRRILTDGYFGQSAVEDAAIAAIELLKRECAVRRPGFKQKLTDSGIWTNFFVAIPDGESVNSFQALAEVLRQKLHLPQFQVGQSGQLVDFVRSHDDVAVLVFDDLIGTGKTAEAVVEKLISALRLEGLDQKVACLLFFAVAAFKDTVRTLNEKFDGTALFSAYRPLTEADQAFHPEAGICEDEDERERARKLAESYGLRLEPKWPLGYGNRQALVAFYRNTPNITLPVFYKGSWRKAFAWRPLLRRM